MRPFALIAVTCLLAGTARGEQVAGWLSKLSVHGYLSQAYAVSDDHQILGIPTGGTVDYRDIALQLRYDASRKNSAVVQLRHARFGDSPRQRDDVELDWAFYQHNFSDRFSVKAGRIPLPLGIFNEAGGPAGGSPFFRPPTEFYERRYSSKTLEGALASLSLGDPGGWSFDVDGYAGRWQVDYGQAERANARDAWGAQVWANTPWTGVRIGAGAYRCEIYPPAGVEADYLMLHASVEADLERWRLASEFIRGNLDTSGRYRAWYAQAGYQFTRRLSVHARGAVARIHVPNDGQAIDADLSEDLGLAVNVAVHPNVLLKLEGHTNDGLLGEDQPFDYAASPSRTRYLIFSITVTY
jgi:hypothetical protein